LDVFEKVKSEEGAENQPDFAGQTGLDERLVRPDRQVPQLPLTFH